MRITMYEIKTMSKYVRMNHPICVIRNPAAGSFVKNLKDFVDGTKEGRRIFYRARVCLDEVGFPKLKMGAPPANLATAGRVNPEGISVLYLANSVRTTYMKYGRESLIS